MPLNPVKSAFGAGIERLPPNPRRRKIPLDQRKRVVRACNSCNLRRIKCSGAIPCAHCASGSRTCEYPAFSQTRNPEQRNKELEERCSLLERCLADAVPSEKDREALLSKLTDTPATDKGLIDISSRQYDEQEKTGDGRLLQDPDGRSRYLGESSGAAFIDRLREFVAKVLPLLPDKNDLPFASAGEVFPLLLGRYHTHDSKQLLLPEVDPFHLPQVAEVRKLLAVFNFYAQNGSEGGIYYWGNLSDIEDQALRYIESSGSSSDAHFLANLNAILALACQYDPRLAPSWELYPGETYFARAKLLLVNPIEDAKLSNMKTLCLMGQYLLGLYRRDAAYLYVGLAGRIAIIHGLHKGWKIHGQGAAGEAIKREFWNTFILDRWLSCLMGRPAIIPGEAVDLAYPINIPDSDLPVATGLCAHAKLSMITDEIVNNVYGTAGAGRSISQIGPDVNVLIQKLNSWMDSLPPSLQYGYHAEPDRACLILHMLFNQLMILCTRPFLFVAAKQAVAAKFNASKQARQHPNILFVSCCSAAARRNAQLSRHLFASNQCSIISTLDYHHAFSAAITILLARLVPEIVSPDDEDDISFLRDYLRETGAKGNESAADCGTIVTEFAAVVSRLLEEPEVRRTNITMSIAEVTATSQNSHIGLSTQPDDSEFCNNPSLPGDLDLAMIPQDELMTFEQLFAWFEDPSY